MLRADIIALGPVLILTATAALVMLMIAVRRSPVITGMLTLYGLAAAFIAVPAAAQWAPQRVTGLLIVDRFALFYIGIILTATAATAVLAYDYLIQQYDGHSEEFFLLLLLAAVGASVLVMSRHFAALFLGLEILSVSLYGLVAYPRRRARSIEAGVKYLVLAAVSAAFLLFGVALIYAQVGSVDFFHMAVALQVFSGPGAQWMLLAGLAMLMVGIGFKLGVVPFHMWTPDVYEGAPAPVTGFVATVSKGAVAALLVRLFAPVDLGQYPTLFAIFAAIAFASMVAGNLLALYQNNLKRLLAYSSIAHMGYILVAFLAGGRSAAGAVTFYIVVYTITTMGSFGVISLLSKNGREADAITDYQGLFFRRPWLAGVFTALLLSLAGIPLTAGFVGKFYIVSSGVNTALWGLIITLVITSGISLFYYLRVIVAMFTAPAGAPAVSGPRTFSITSSGLLLAILSGLVIWLGVMPGSLLDLIQRVVG